VQRNRSNNTVIGRSWNPGGQNTIEHNGLIKSERNSHLNH